MNSKVRIFILAAVLVLLLGGAWFAYAALSERADSPALASPPPDTTSVPKGAAKTTGMPSNGSAKETGPDGDSDRAPDFTVYTEDGEEVRLSDFIGRPVILNFWATWCVYCTLEMPMFQEMWEELGGEIQFLLVDCTDGQTETVETGSEYIAGEGYTFPVYYDTEQEAQYLYGIRSLPMTLFIDADGKIAGSHVGMLTQELFEQGLERIMEDEDGI